MSNQLTTAKAQRHLDRIGQAFAKGSFGLDQQPVNDDFNRVLLVFGEALEVRQIVRRSPYVTGWRPGHRHEGGDGVTIAWVGGR